MYLLSSFFFVSPLVLRAPSTDRPETLPHGRNRAEFYNPTPKIRRALPQKIWGIKTCKMSVTPHVELNKFVYFGPQTTEFIPLINLHPNGFFSGYYISALRGCCALKFLHVLEIHQGLLAHTPSGAGVPPPPKNKFNRENLKFS